MAEKVDQDVRSEAIKAMLMRQVFDYDRRFKGKFLGDGDVNFYPLQCRYEHKNEPKYALEAFVSEAAYFSLLDEFGLRQMHDELHGTAITALMEGEGK